MSITETVLTFVGAPALVIGVIYALVYGGSAARGKRYRPGRPFSSEPVWYLAGNQTTHPASSSAALAGRPVLDNADAVRHGETGGASDSW